MDRMLGHLPAVGAFSPSRRSFSAIGRLSSGELDGQVLLHKQPCGEEPENSITRLCGMGQAGYQPWPVFWARSDEALLLGRHGIWRNPQREFCLEAVYYHEERHGLRDDHLTARCWVPSPEILPGAWTSLASCWADGTNYYHWLFDGLTRLMVREHLPETTRILIPSRIKPFASETLEMLGLGDFTTPLSGRPLRPERFYFCSPTAMTGAWNPVGCDWLRQAFSDYRGPSRSGPPVFFTRRGVSRVPAESKEIESMFQEYGFEVVECAELTVREQIKRSSEASAIAGFHGAAMSNLVWAHPGTPVLEIFTPAYLNGCYEQIAFQGNLDYTYFIAQGGDILSKAAAWLELGAALRSVVLRTR
jgi:hypothetical protein